MNREGGTPYYFRVAETIRSRIRSGIYPPDYMIPPVHQLAAEFGVSIITIQKAMDLLVREGFIVRRRGIGTRVIKKDEYRLEKQLFAKNFWDWFEVCKDRYEVEIDIAEIPCPEFVKTILHFSNPTIMMAKRVMKVEGEPISYFINYFPRSLLPEDAYKEIAATRFMKVLRLKANTKPMKLDQRVEAAIADMDLARILQIHFGDPLFFVEHIYYSMDGAPLALTNMFHRADRHVLRNTMIINGDTVP